MSEVIIVAIVTGLFAFAGTALTVWGTSRKSAAEAAAQRTEILLRLDQLEAKQDKHNKVIERTYELEKTAALHEEEIKVANHRIADLENKVA